MLVVFKIIALLQVGLTAFFNILGTVVPLKSLRTIARIQFFFKKVFELMSPTDIYFYNIIYSIKRFINK